MQLTEDQLKMAAIMLCEKRGVDPFEDIGHSAETDENGYVPAVMLFSPRWKLVSNEIQYHMDIQHCVQTAVEWS